MSELADLPPGSIGLEQWDALEVAHTRRWELSEGNLVMSPRPQAPHQRISKRVVQLLDANLVDGLEVLPEMEVTTSASFPPSVRHPDIVVASSRAFDHASSRVPAADVVLVVEIVSPGSRGTDHVMKLYEYAKAGIEHYWIVDAEAPTGEWFLAYRLDGDVYRSVAVLDGDCAEVHQPVQMRFRLDELTR
ncbi:Uma2 family endonuclease [Mycobacterium sp. M1]|uniref:Uma2 family endonuclease n=1 Tax=Mycolicibacter acidiphilus TaxID=2835306 RepID=A0ABS5RKT7_9MYCO|nr:Uma2 family endonuclease [Mycolicibacter acidiphilus]MBS9534218.1 Uma2 family endonuclease [Mycolicibacter acidiphilus]